MNASRYLTRTAIAALLACGTFAPRSIVADEPIAVRPIVVRFAPAAEVRLFDIVAASDEDTPQNAEPRNDASQDDALKSDTAKSETAQPEAATQPNDTIVIRRLENGKLDPATLEKLQELMRRRQSNAAFRVESVPQTYWLGVEARAIDPAMRKPLKLEGEAGVVVARVVENSPAAKSGLVEGDILIRFADHELKTVEQLIEVVQRSDGKPAKLTLRRDDDVKTIEIAPQLRVAEAQPPIAATVTLGEQLQAREEALKADKRMEEWRKQMAECGFPVPPNVVAAPGAFDIVRPAPGIVFHAAKRRWPDDLSVAIERKGNAPAQITVTQGEKTLSVSEKELNKLPAEWRGFVEEMLGRGATTWNATPRSEAVPGAPVRFSVTLPDDAYLNKPPATVKATEVAPSQGLHKIVIGKHDDEKAKAPDATELRALHDQLRRMQRQLDAIQKQTESQARNAKRAAESKADKAAADKATEQETPPSKTDD